MNSRRAASLEEFLALLELESVHVNEVSGRRRDSFDLEAVPVRTQSEIAVRQTLRDDLLTFRSRIEVGTDQASLIADVSAHFRLAAPIERPPDEILDAFARNEGLPLTLPYLRVTLQQAARHIGVPAPLLKHLWGHELTRLTLERDAAQRDPGPRE